MRGWSRPTKASRLAATVGKARRARRRQNHAVSEDRGAIETFSNEQSIPLHAARLPEKGSLLQFRECLLQLLLRVHHDGPVPCDGFLERFARDEQEAHSIFSTLDLAFVAPVKQADRPLVGFRGMPCIPHLHA